MINIEASSLRRMLEQVTPHMADPEDHLPVICSVQFEVRDGWLYAAATDRFTFAVSRREVPGAVGQWRIGHIPASHLPAVTAWLDMQVDLGRDVGLSLPVAEDAPVILSGAAEAKLTIGYDADDYKTFPQWRKIFRAALTAEPTVIPMTGFTTKFLARWQHAADKLTTWQQAPNKPIVLIDELGYFLGLHMPVRQEGLTREGIAGSWLAVTTPTATAEGRTYDLTKTWADRDGDPWTYSGKDDRNGTPLMVIDGIEDDPYPLDQVIAVHGPLNSIA